jgi:hypothetical protein
MKRLIFTLCLLFLPIMSVNASDLYRYKDSHGDTVITDSPQFEMKNWRSFETDASSEEQKQKNLTIKKTTKHRQKI